MAHPVLASTLPDLTITAITLSPQLPRVGDNATINIVVKNLGVASTQNSHLTGAIDGEEVLSIWLDPLAAGASVTRAFTWQAEAGDHFFTAMADADDDVAESDETNNSSIISFSTLAPDLLVKSITWMPQSPSIGETVNFTVLIENAGDEISPWSSVQFLIDGVSLGYYDVPRIPPGDKVTTSLSWTSQTGNHLIGAIIDPLSKIPEINETNNELLVGYSTAAPDLVVANVAWTMGTVYPNLFATFSLEIGNIGSGNSNSVNLAYFIDGVYEDTLFLGPISAESTIVEELNHSVEGGSHSFRFVIDYDNRVAEADETNNEKTVQLNAWCPDLTLFIDRVDPANRREGDIVTVRVAVNNIGKTRADGCKIDYYLNGKLVKQGNIGAIEPGSSVFDNLVYTVHAASYDLKVKVDPENLIMEEDEENNVREIELDNDVKPDLVLPYILVSPQSPDIGEAVAIAVTVKNLGPGRAPSSNVVFYIDGTENAVKQIKDLNSGEETSAVFNWTAQVGTHALKIVADVANWVSETNEDNNEKTVAVTANTPDLAISAISWSPQEPAPGDTVTFTASIKNQGIARADEFCIQYLVDGMPKGVNSIAALEIGGSRAKDFFWIAEPGFHEVTFEVDYENNVAEIDENNNNLTVGFPPPDIAIVTFSSSAASPADGDTIMLDLKVANQGAGKSVPSRVQIEVDGAPLTTVDLPGLSPDGSFQQSFPWEAVAGAHTVKATADASNIVWEINEGNNEKSLLLTVLSQQGAGSHPGASEVIEPGPEASNPLADVRASIFGKITEVEPRGYLVLTMRAANAGSTDVNFNVNLVLPDGMSMAFPESELAGDNTYVFNINLEAGEQEQLDISIKAIYDGSFVIEGYFEPGSDLMQSFSIPVTVKNRGGLWFLSGSGFYLIGAIVAIIIIISVVILVRSRPS